MRVPRVVIASREKRNTARPPLAIEPLLVGGRPVPVSRILHEAAPELFASLEPIDPNRDVPWSTVSARLEPGSDELLMAIEIDGQEDVTTVVAVRLP
jgi:hypothetical protein